jgi:hypothetical protein
MCCNLTKNKNDCFRYNKSLMDLRIGKEHENTPDFFRLRHVKSENESIYKSIDIFTKLNNRCCQYLLYETMILKRRLHVDNCGIT